MQDEVELRPTTAHSAQSRSKALLHINKSRVRQGWANYDPRAGPRDHFIRPSGT